MIIAGGSAWRHLNRRCNGSAAPPAAGLLGVKRGIGVAENVAALISCRENIGGVAGVALGWRLALGMRRRVASSAKSDGWRINQRRGGSPRRRRRQLSVGCRRVCSWPWRHRSISRWRKCWRLISACGLGVRGAAGYRRWHLSAWQAMWLGGGLSAKGSQHLAAGSGGVGNGGGAARGS
jgi:hypothetical protein